MSLHVSCDNGTVADLGIAARTTGTVALDPKVVVREPATCTVAETATGEDPSATLTETTYSVDGGAAASGTSHAVAVPSGAAVSMAFTDVYGGLAPTGASPATPAYALLGLLLVALGAATYRAAGS